ncbi:ATP-binding protein [Endothiovibrio diazotrophicus]
MKLGGKLVLSSAVLLALPWLGYRYLGAMEEFLYRGQERAQALAAQAVATVLHGRRDLFDGGDALPAPLGRHGALYAYPLPAPPVIDGYADDWGELTGRAVHHGAEGLTRPTADGRPPSVAFDLLLGSRGDDLYALVTVSDERIVYRHPGYRRLDNSDQLRLTYSDPAGEIQRLLLTTEGPGSVTAYRMDHRWRYPLDGSPLYRLRAQWQEFPGGYRVELRLPLDLLGPKRRLRLAVADVDDPEVREVNAEVATLPSRWSEELNHLVLRSEALERILAGLEQGDARVWVVDRQRRIRAAVGGDGLEWDTAEELPETLVGTALAGRTEVLRRRAPYGGGTLVATAPIRADDGETVLGAVVLEQESGATLALHIRTLLQVTLATGAVLLLTIAALLLFGGRLAWRIRRLGRESEAAIDDTGRLLHDRLTAERDSGDELGGLSRTISTLLGRLRRYTGFLENIPRTLRHEINNPLNTISTSLQNLADAHPELAGDRYLAGAERGVARIGRIMQSLTEAASLEQALRHDERHPFDLAALAHAYLESCTAQHPEKRFRYAGKEEGIDVRGSDLRLEQLLDKLLGNAVEFTPDGGEIVVGLESDKAAVRLTVTNDGQPLPEGLRDRLFDSMVSLRRDQDPENPHLGIGLYVARTIAEHHGGRLEAADRPGGNGAAFTLHLPLDASGS